MYKPYKPSPNGHRSSSIPRKSRVCRVVRPCLTQRRPPSLSLTHTSKLETTWCSKTVLEVWAHSIHYQGNSDASPEKNIKNTKTAGISHHFTVGSYGCSCPPTTYGSIVCIACKLQTVGSSTTCGGSFPYKYHLRFSITNHPFWGTRHLWKPPCPIDVHRIFAPCFSQPKTHVQAMQVPCNPIVLGRIFQLCNARLDI